jgi:hypothetical protein
MIKINLFMLIMIIITSGALYISCDDKTSKKITNITNNTTEIQGDPEPLYVEGLAALDPDVTATEMCYANQVFYVFNKTVTKEETVGRGKHKYCITKVEQEVVGMMYRLDTLGRPIQCGVPTE